MFITKPVITDRKIRFALVGCGRIAENHFEALARHAADAELVAVCDTDPAGPASRHARGPARRLRLHYGELLARPDADCVVLATPSGLHPEQAIRGGRRRAVTS